MSELITTQSVMDGMAEWIKGIFKGQTFQTVDGKRVPLNVFVQGLPQPTKADTDIELEAVPYAIAHVTGGEITGWNEPQVCSVILLLCTYDESADRQGYRDILSMKERILAAMLRDPHIGPAEVLPPIEWSLNEADVFPFYFGAFSFKIATRKIEAREERLI